MVVALDLKVREYRYTCMLVNDFYMNQGYIHAIHYSFVVVTCMIDVSESTWSYARSSDSHAWQLTCCYMHCGHMHDGYGHCN